MQDWCGVCGDVRWFAQVPDSDRPSDADYACVDCGAAWWVPAEEPGYATVP